MSAPRYRFGKHDRITMHGVTYRWDKSTDAGHVFERLDQPGVYEDFTDWQVAAAAAMRSGYRYDRAWFAPGRAVARSTAGVGDLHDIPAAEVPELLWRHAWCLAFMESEKAGKASRSDAGMKAAIETIAADMAAIEEAKAAKGGKKLKAGAVCIVRTRPSSKTLRRWVKRLEAGHYDPMMLRKGHHRCGNREPRLSADLEALVCEHAGEYASEAKPTKAVCYQNLKAAVDELNLQLRAAGRPELACPSREVVSDRIGRLDAFTVHAARYGLESAKRKYAMLGSGLDVTRPGERIEMDDWNVHLQTLLVKLGLWKDMTEEMRKAVERVRIWLCLAIDAASRCVLGMTATRSPSADSAIATLHMVVRDKTPYAAAVGALTPWDMTCTPEAVVTDNGSTLICDAFKSKVVALKSSPHATPAGQPQLRARVERVFSTIEQQLLARFVGRTFANVVAKGDYDAEARAELEVEALCQALVLYVVDIYHNSPHAGLKGETPRNAWIRLSATYGTCPPPGRDLRRHIFGIEVTRVTGPHGVRILNLDFSGKALQERRRRVGDQQVAVRIDPLDLGRASVSLDGEWFTCECRTAGFDDVAIDTWLAAAADLRRRHAKHAKLTEHIVLEAIRAIEAMATRGIEQFDLGDVRPSRETIDRAERDLAIGFRMPDRANAPPSEKSHDDDLLAGAIDGTGPQSAAWLAERMPDQATPPATSTPFYRIEEDD